MGDIANTTTEKSSKKSWFKGLKSEFKKIVWPTKDTLTKQSVAVVVVTLILGVIIFALDTIIEHGISFILG
ncbi:MAG: preprotein translocase subunit SecE [Clostridiales bacterium]|jgi:preprotein translocase subunit SecE|nr:preprotein translocase subunit SecE [Clostridiales bacterium]